MFKINTLLSWDQNSVSPLLALGGTSKTWLVYSVFKYFIYLANSHYSNITLRFRWSFSILCLKLDVTCLATFWFALFIIFIIVVLAPFS
jgi:hypothetical protein